MSILATLPAVGNAQCPDANWPPGDPLNPEAWSGPLTKGPVTVIPTACQVTYTVCERAYWDSYALKYVDEQVVESVTPVPGCTGCDSIPPDSILKNLFLQLQNECIGCGPGAMIPLCGSDTTSFQTLFAMGCWASFPSLTGVFYAGCNSGSYCATTCQVCEEGLGGPYDIINCTTSSYGTDLCPPPPQFPNIWQPGECYSTGCFGNM